MNDPTNDNDSAGLNETPKPASASEVTAEPQAARPARNRAARPVGSGVMGSRLRDDEPAPPLEVINQAATTARATGHRFDLMRYLRLRRRGDHT